MKQNNQRTILFSKYDYTKPYYPNDLTGKEVLLYNYILGLKKGFEELHHCKMTYMYLSYSHFNSIHKMDWRTYDKAFHGLVQKLYLVKEEGGEYTFFPAKFNDYPSDVNIAKAFIMQNFGHSYEGNSLDTFDGGFRNSRDRKQFKDTWELAGDELELDIWPEVPEEYKDLDKKDLCPESCVSHDEDIPFKIITR